MAKANAPLLQRYNSSPQSIAIYTTIGCPLARAAALLLWRPEFVQPYNKNIRPPNMSGRPNYAYKTALCAVFDRVAIDR